MKKGFTLIEMLVVIGIIAVLIGASMTSFSKVMQKAERAKAQELVSQVATALTAIYDADGMWPQRLRTAGESGGQLDADTAYILAKRGYLSLSQANGKLVGKDRFGILTPWAAKVVEQRSSSVSLQTPVNAGLTIADNQLRFAIDADGDGKIENMDTTRGGSDYLRGTVAVWCVDKSGKGYIQSWTKDQTRKPEE